MSAVDDILDGLDFDGVDGSARYPYIKPGKYTFAVKKIFIASGFKGGRFTVELEVLTAEKATADDVPSEVGATVSWIQKLGGQSKAALMGPNNVVGFLSAATGFSGQLFKSTPADKDAGKKRIKQVVGVLDGTMPEGPLVKAGVRVSGVCYKTISEGGKEISPTAFSMMAGYTLLALKSGGEAQATQAPANA